MNQYSYVVQCFFYFVTNSMQEILIKLNVPSKKHHSHPRIGARIMMDMAIMNNLAYRLENIIFSLI